MSELAFNPDGEPFELPVTATGWRVRKFKSSTIDAIDVAAVAKLLRVGRNTVYAMVARNEIPHRRLGKQIRFHREAVMRWLASWSWQGAKERR